MTILRTICPHCDVVRVRAPEATVRKVDGAAHVEVDFTCPGCSGHVVQQLNARMIPLLLSAGCLLVEEDSVDLGDGGISEQEIRDFVAALDGTDWSDELAY